MFCVCLRQICGSYFYMIYMKISDEGLWELCLKGDMRAFRELYCRFYALLRNYGIKLLPDKSLVEDCVQDIFYQIDSKPRDFISNCKCQRLLTQDFKA